LKKANEVNGELSKQFAAAGFAVTRVVQQPPTALTPESTQPSDTVSCFAFLLVILAIDHVSISFTPAQTFKFQVCLLNNSMNNV
jgi:hypothetical protein